MSFQPRTKQSMKKVQGTSFNNRNISVCGIRALINNQPNTNAQNATITILLGTQGDPHNTINNMGIPILYNMSTISKRFQHILLSIFIMIKTIYRHNHNQLKSISQNKIKKSHTFKLIKI
ncbi:hypothetical protein V6Z11_D06G078800 [Gossypium hirsutum]